jgi:hypothetical protein
VTGGNPVALGVVTPGVSPAGGAGGLLHNVIPVSSGYSPMMSSSPAASASSIHHHHHQKNSMDFAEYQFRHRVDEGKETHTHTLTPSSRLAQGAEAFAVLLDQFWLQAGSSLTARVHSALNDLLKDQITRWIHLPAFMGEPQLRRMDLGNPLSLQVGRLSHDPIRNEFLLNVDYRGQGSLVLQCASQVVLCLSQLEMVCSTLLMFI